MSALSDDPLDRDRLPTRRLEESMAGKGQTLLVVEDDQETLNVVSRTLAAGGYDVLWARNGAETLKLLTRFDKRIAVVVVDVVLPGMSGPELVEKLNEQCPGITPIFVSAYDDDTVRSHGVDPDEVAFLSKPYDPGDLLREVEEALR